MHDSKLNSVVSMSGSPILCHGAPSRWQAPQGDESVRQISSHIQTYLGRVGTVLHETIPDTVHVDLHWVPATSTFPYCRIITSGMSDLPMAVPDEVDAPRFAELMITLPGDWQLSHDSFQQEDWYWPIRLLKTLSRLPHKHHTWLGWGHTVNNGNPIEPYAPTTELCSAVLLPSISTPHPFHTLTIDEDKVIHFYSVVPLYEEEVRLKLHAGLDALLDRFDEVGLGDIVDPERENLVREELAFA